MIIAIDGPAGAGKSTVARHVARELGLVFLDTGAMYRAVTWRVLEQRLDPASEEQCARVACSTILNFDDDGRILVDGRAGEPDIRSREVTANVSAVSAHAAVRAEVVREQQLVAERRGGLVAEGRDTTTVVFPRAEHKFFLIASSTERARRRAAEVGRPEMQAEIQREIEARDLADSTRAHSPLVQAPDAIVIDTDGLDADAVALRILAHVRAEPQVAQRSTDGSRPAPKAGLRAAAESADGEPLLTHITFVYWLTRTLMKLWFLVYFRRRIAGREHLPQTGAFLVAANHQSYLDIPLIAIAVPRHVSFVARKSLSDSAALAYVMRQCGAVLVKPGKADRGALRGMVAHLLAGDCVSIFPEGTRTPDGEMQVFKAGATMAARSAGVPIVPCMIDGTYGAWGKGVGFPRPRRVSIRFAAPLDSAQPDALEKIRAEITRMLAEPH
ncbi:MAG TPA: (d)CMP kinase [Planctomycetota bacterium]|nr:(d)CMP kinase [Planctomycetota bacterium]